jgi:hypothetical protein
MIARSPKYCRILHLSGLASSRAFLFSERTQKPQQHEYAWGADHIKYDQGKKAPESQVLVCDSDQHSLLFFIHSDHHNPDPSNTSSGSQFIFNIVHMSAIYTGQ